jgi:hypothetical protein
LPLYAISRSNWSPESAEARPLFKRLVRVVPGSARNWRTVNAVQQPNLNKKYDNSTLKKINRPLAFMKMRAFVAPSRRPPGLSTALVIVVLSLLSGGTSVRAQAHPPLQYKCGPVLETFKIVPLYWGQWTKAEIDAQQDYLTGLAAYISGDGAPKGQVPMLRQYGVNSASVAAPVTADPKGVKAFAQADIVNIIKNNAGKLPAFGFHTLIMVFPGKGSTLTTSTGCGYHSQESSTAFWAVVLHDCSPTLALVTAHEVFEAATDPAGNLAYGWISQNGVEAVDQCNSAKFPFITLPFGQIPGAADDTQRGACSTTGYIDAQKKFNQVSFDIVTGGDDLRGDSSATATICFPGGSQTFTLKSQSDGGWDNNSDHVKTFSITGPALPLSFFGSITITLTSHNSWPETDDNWDIQSVRVTVTGPDGSGSALDQKGNPLSRLTGSSPSVALFRGTDW